MPSTKSTPAEATQEINRVVGLWRSTRNQQIQNWYRILLQEDSLKQEGMESFISNDARTAYNLARHLITPKRIPVKIPVDPITREEVPQAGEIQRGVQTIWERVDSFNRQRGRGGWAREFNGFSLATGWYAVLALVFHNQDTKLDEAIAEIWAPTDTYPEFDNDVGLVQVIHRYQITLGAFNKKAKANGWKVPTGLGTVITLDDWWFLDDDTGKVVNSIWINSNEVKQYQEETTLTRIPVVISPTGGLPDKGSIIIDQTWRQHVGEAMVATNEQVLQNYNRQMTFLQQLLRDTAQATSYEKNTGVKIVNNPEELYRRGAHFRMGINEDMGYLAKPPIPVEVRTQLFDIHGMVQRGSLPDVMFGNLQGQVNGFLISQVASSAQQMLSDYGDAFEFSVADVSNLWCEQIEAGSFQPFGLKIPKRPPGVMFIGDLHIQVPGDLTNRATVARMLNPDFELSEQLVMDLMFPGEIADPSRESARVSAERALRNPISLQIQLISAFEEQARVLQAAGDRDQAARYMTAAQTLDQQLKNPQSPLLGQTSGPLPVKPISIGSGGGGSPNGASQQPLPAATPNGTGA